MVINVVLLSLLLTLKRFHIVLVKDIIVMFLLLTLNIFHTFFQCFYFDFDQLNVSWVQIVALKPTKNYRETSLTEGFYRHLWRAPFVLHMPLLLFAVTLRKSSCSYNVFISIILCKETFLKCGFRLKTDIVLTLFFTNL